MKYYTGIGSRETPLEICDLMIQLAKKMSDSGYTLRSGGAGGADFAFERGCTGPKEIYLPWKGFNGSDSPLFTPSDDAVRMAASYHPAWHRCSQGARKMHARNCHQVLGLDLKTPSDLIICWTKDKGPSGGTGQALRIALAHNIPITYL